MHSLYSNFGQTNANADTQYDLGRQCTQLTGTAGLDDSSTQGTQVDVEILADGTQIGDYTLNFGQAQPISLSLTNVLRLDIQATDIGSDGSTVAALGNVAVTCTAKDQVYRLAGNTRIETAIAVSNDSYASSQTASAVVLARDDDFADALAGTPLAIQKDGPVLLTEPGQLDSETQTEIQRVLSPSGTVYLLGGTAALSSSVESAVQSMGYKVVRLAGSDRYGTAVAIAEQGMGSPANVLLADGTQFGDAEIAGPVSPMVGGAAILLTAGSELPEETSAYLQSHQSGTDYAIGSNAAEADPYAQGVTSDDDGPDLSAKVAETFFPSPATVSIASDATFPDGLSGGAHSAKVGDAPLLLTDPQSLSSSLDQYLQDADGTITTAYVYGGSQAVSDSVDSQVQSDMAGQSQ